MVKTTKTGLKEGGVAGRNKKEVGRSFEEENVDGKRRLRSI